jgi:hypothetical protein
MRQDSVDNSHYLEPAQVSVVSTLREYMDDYCDVPWSLEVVAAAPMLVTNHRPRIVADWCYIVPRQCPGHRAGGAVVLISGAVWLC